MTLIETSFILEVFLASEIFIFEGWDVTQFLAQNANGQKGTAMHYNEKTIFLKNGTECTLRNPRESEAVQFTAHLRRVAGETHFLARYEEEVVTPSERQAQIIREALECDDRMLLAVWINDRPIGSIGVNRVSPHIKMQHRAQLGISIERAYWNMGLGTILIKEALEAAREMGCEQVELGVYSDNERARALYRKLGFEEWGVVRNAYRLKGGAYCDEIMMGRSL